MVKKRSFAKKDLGVLVSSTMNTINRLVCSNRSVASRLNPVVPRLFGTNKVMSGGLCPVGVASPSKTRTQWARPVKGRQYSQGWSTRHMRTGWETWLQSAWTKAHGSILLLSSATWPQRRCSNSLLRSEQRGDQRQQTQAGTYKIPVKY